jgi:inosine-uridine nucleoside N-ribohydrolase
MVALGLSLLLSTEAADGSPARVIIDADPGVDDAMAILLAFQSPAVEVVGITTVFGNVSQDNAVANALTLVDLAGSSVPVARGAEHPLVKDRRDPPTFVHGKDGLGEAGRQRPVGSVIDMTGAQFIVDMARRYPGEITLVPIGPLTNIALALAIEPNLPDLIKEVVLMGGAARTEGNVSPVAEANIFGDPHAADIVFKTPWQVTMVGLDVTTKVRLKDDLLKRIAEANPKLGEFIFSISRFYKKFYESNGVTGGFYTHDPSAVAYVIDRTLFATEQARVRVASEGLAAGQTMTTFRNPPPAFWAPWFGAPEVRVCTGVDDAKVLALLESTLSG